MVFILYFFIWANEIILSPFSLYWKEYIFKVCAINFETNTKFQWFYRNVPNLLNMGSLNQMKTFDYKILTIFIIKYLKMWYNKMQYDDIHYKMILIKCEW